MVKKETRKFNQALLVEGIDDMHVVANLAQQLGLKHNFDILPKDSVENVVKSIRAELREPNMKTIGILVDADLNVANRWHSIKNELAKEGYSIPEPQPEGIIIQHPDKPKVGIWIMPDNKTTGMLEDFVAHLIPEHDPLLEHANETLNFLEKKGLSKYNPIHRAKALIHTWLAWQESPGTPMGQAITKRYLTETESEVCKAFVKWLKILFGA